MSTLDTPEHAACRAMILAHGTEDHERTQEILDHEDRMWDLKCDRDSLDEYVTELNDQADRLRKEIAELEKKLQAS